MAAAKAAVEAGGGGSAELAAMIETQEALIKDAQAAVNFCNLKSKDQGRALEYLEQDAGLLSLDRIEAPLFDLEIRGVPALQFMANTVWTD